MIILVETCLCWKVCSTTKQVDPSPLINLRSIPNTFYDLGCIPKYTESIPTDPKKGVIRYCRLVYVEKFATEQLDPSPLINLGPVSQLPLSSYVWNYNAKFRMDEYNGYFKCSDYYGWIYELWFSLTTSSFIIYVEVKP